jgi:hypothetical protein
VRLEETFVDHYGEPMSLGGVIVHVVLHNAGHRTEALHILTRLGLPDVLEIDHGLWDHLSRGAWPVGPGGPSGRPARVCSQQPIPSPSAGSGIAPHWSLPP